MIKHLLLSCLLAGQICNPIVEAGSKNRPVILQMWKEDGNGWWYENDDGTYPRNAFAVINGSTYYFDASGYMVTGWRSINNKWYFFNSSGSMKTNAWEGNYYLKADGTMAVSEWIDVNHYVGADGMLIEGYGIPRWRQNPAGWWYDDGYGNYPADQLFDINGKTYYFNSRGYMVTGWLKLDGTWYFFDSSGAMKKNAWEGNYYLKEDGSMAISEWVQGKKYYVGKDGQWIENYGKPRWVKSGSNWKYDRGEDDYIIGQFAVIGSNKYYFDDDGIMVTGWKRFANGWYYFQTSGAMTTGWINVSGKWYYMNSDGVMHIGWIKLGGYWYYLSESGAMKTGWLKDSGRWYYFDESGHMKTGWIRVNWYWYYLGSNGAMLTGYQNIGGKTYHLNESTGAWDEPEGDPKFYRPDSLLIIANKSHKLPEGYEPSDLVIPDVRKTGANPYLRAPAAAALEQMFNAAASQGVYLVLGSGYRSQSTQAAIYNNYVARDGQAAADRYSARPGYSEHQTGLAVDISDYSGATYLSTSFAYTSEAQWLYSNAHKYGFIMRYPQGKEHITGYMYEPWHFRYVGVSTATAIYNSGLTVEEYYGISGGTSY